MPRILDETATTTLPDNNQEQVPLVQVAPPNLTIQNQATDFWNFFSAENLALTSLVQ